MNKFLLLPVFAVALSLSLVSTPASAATPPDSCFAFNAGTGTITDYYDHEANNPSNPACTRDVDIPSTIGGVSVTTIGEALNYYNSSTATSFAWKSLNSVTIPSSVTSIQTAAFYGNNLATVTVSGTVQNIGSMAFARNNLQSVTLNEGTMVIDQLSFTDNEIINVHIPDSVTTIGHAAFWNNSIESLHIGSGASTIGSSSFGRNKLEELVIPDAVETISNQAFGHNNIHTLTLGSNLKSINGNAFQFNNISEVYLPDGFTTLSPYAFEAQSAIDSREFYSLYYGGCEGTCEDLHAAIASQYYTRIYTSDSTNPHDIKDSVLFDEIEYTGDDDWQDIASKGGHIVNPARLELKYLNISNQNLTQTLQIVGMAEDSSLLTNYLQVDGPTIPMPIDVWNITPAEQAAIDEALSAYYRIGDSVTITPPAISGYITPPTQTFVLGAADNEFSYIYAAPEDEESGTGAGTDGSESSTDGELANTGMSIHTIIMLAGTLIATAILAFTKMNKRKGMTL